MPNHVKHFVTITAPKMTDSVVNKIDKLLNELTNGENVFDFNKIIPMPKDLVNTTSPSPKTNTELIEQYGADNWYDWSIANWGTKWNSYEGVRNEFNVVSFLTAWSTPVEVIHALSKQYPKYLFSVEYADEDIGNNTGRYSIKNGKVIEDVVEDEDFANEVWER